MANICLFQAITKLQRFSFVYSIQSVIVNKHSQYFASISNLKKSSHKAEHIKYININKNVKDLHRFEQCKRFSTGKSSTSTLSSSSMNIDPINDFRAREEQKEKEFAEQQEPPPPEDEKTEKENLIRSKILEASLPFVLKHGWSRKAIAQGAETIGYAGVVHGMFPNGRTDLIRYFYSKCNQELIEYMKKETNNAENIPDKPIEFVINSTKLRLQMIEPYVEHWPQALALLSMPKNTAESLAQLLTLVDDICYYSGDRSVDFGWYTRRVGLAMIYKMTEIYMLGDDSVERQATWNFLKQRMEEALNIQLFLSQSDDTTKNVKKSFNSIFTTARNILGLEFNQR